VARLSRNARLETRDARARLKIQNEPYWHQITPGVFLGYRKGKSGGTWRARVAAGEKYAYHQIGKADDFADADGVSVLDFKQAHKQTLRISEGETRPIASSGGYDVADAMEAYLADYRTRGKDWRGAEQSYHAHIEKQLGNVPLARLTAERLRRWLNNLAATDSQDPDEQRKRKATANRVFNILRAGLNLAYQNDRVDSDRAWKQVKSFRNVDLPRVEYLTPAEAMRLLNACEGDFRALVHGALLTGCRYGELTRLEAGDFDPSAGKVFVRFTKSGNPRHVPLSAEGAAFFSRQAAGKRRGDLMFTRAGGGSWGRAHQHRRIKAACAAAGIDPAISFHILRHTYGSALAQAGVPLKVIAEALGHADTRMTERHYGHLSDEYIARQVRENLPSFGFEPDNVASIGAER